MKSSVSFKHLGKDLPASLVVFLVALPLCLGVALASGAPLLSGLIAGIVGGIVVGMLSGSHSSVSGPAAGLTAIVATSIETLHTPGTFGTEGALEKVFPLFLVAVVLAGVIQIILGVAKAGVISNYFPSSVIKGLLAAIGIILIFKQIPHAVGYDKNVEGDFSFFQADGQNTLTELWNMTNYISWGAIIVTLACIGLMLLWDKTKLKKLPVPSALIAVLFGIALNAVFKAFLPGLYIGQEHLVNLPVFESMNDVAAMFTLPDWSALSRVAVYVIAVKIAVVASLETLLNLEAVDKLDKERRYSPPNRELIAQGVGNVTAGLIGGIPVTSVVVRSSVNLNSGAKTKMSAIMHGALLLFSTLFIARYLNMIPYSALAAILLLTGYKLASVAVFKDMYKKGAHQFLPFVITVAAIFFTDLLVGIIIGLAVAFFFILRNNRRSGFRHATEKYPAGEIIRIKLAPHVTFLNKEPLVTTLNELKEGSEVVLDATDTDYIDFDVLEYIREFKAECLQSGTVKLSLIGFKDAYKIPDFIIYKDVITKEVQNDLTPSSVLEILREGNKRFIEGQSRNRDLLRQAKQTYKEQHPMAVLVGCIDSRSTSETIFDLGLGDIFNARVAGSVATPEVIGSVEYATKVAGAKLIVVKGHSNCGAVKAACDGVRLGNVTQILEKIQPAIDSEVETLSNRNSSNDRFVANVTRLNVRHTMMEIRKNSPLIDEMLKSGEIGMVGAVHDLLTGQVHFIAYNEEWKKSMVEAEPEWN
jgi:carbonic anhydrase